ncbi:MAG: hypothetical protein A2Z96_01135 [Spirochaetes bacterium GWB1_48_6]|nr:MAG: hypothetical protein A2Z96_01135 [Spirochaetes bacterium GWB1_48_6]
MEFIPIPYFGMIMSLFVAPALTFGFILISKKYKADVEKLRIKKEILELEIRKEEIQIKKIEEENIKLDKFIEAHTSSNIK